MNKFSKILVTGGAGYVGSVLVPKLLEKGYKVKVLDLYLYGDDVLDSVKNNPNLEQIKGDIRDKNLLEKIIPGTDAIIHLACVSNDPSYELNPELSKTINYDAFIPLVEISKKNKVKRFIFASSSSVYGIKKEENVTEDLPLEPLTDYSKYKALCEKILLETQSPGFVVTIVRPATICGYSPRMRFDLTVNILTNLAYNKGQITVFGGEQKRPNLNIKDMVNLYTQLLEEPDEKISGEIFNVGYENHTVMEIAELVKKTVSEITGKEIEIIRTPTDDLRSYHISSEKIKKKLSFIPKYTIVDAIKEICYYFKQGKLPNSLTDIRYFNVKTMKERNLK